MQDIEEELLDQKRRKAEEKKGVKRKAKEQATKESQINYLEGEPKTYVEVIIPMPENEEEKEEAMKDMTAFIATALRKQRVEVKEKQLGRKEKEMFTQAKDKEIKAWVANKVVQMVSKEKLLTIPNAKVLGMRWILVWKQDDTEVERVTKE